MPASNWSSPVASTYRVTAAAISAFTWNAAVPAGQYAEHSAPSIVRQGKVAPRRPSWLARSIAPGSVLCRQRSTLTAASGMV